MRCDLNMTNCERFDTLAINDVCRILNLQNQLWSDFMAHAEPKVTCPMKKATVKITNANVDLGYFAHLPLDGHAWAFSVKVFKLGAKKRHKRIVRQLFCMTFEIAITKARPERRKRPKQPKSVQKTKSLS